MCACRDVHCDEVEVVLALAATSMLCQAASWCHSITEAGQNASLANCVCHANTTRPCSSPPAGRGQRKHGLICGRNSADSIRLLPHKGEAGKWQAWQQTKQSGSQHKAALPSNPPPPLNWPKQSQVWRAVKNLKKETDLLLESESRAHKENNRAEATRSRPWTECKQQ